MDGDTALAPDRNVAASIRSSHWDLISNTRHQGFRQESLLQNTSRQWWCITALFFIGLVSAYDAWLVKIYEPVMCDVEKNPMATYIIVFSGNAVEPFLYCKAAGTLLVLTILWLMSRHTPRLAMPVINSVAAFQLLLLVFLHVAEK